MYAVKDKQGRIIITWSHLISSWPFTGKHKNIIEHRKCERKINKKL